MKKTTLNITAAALALGLVGHSDAGTIDAHSFNAVTDAAVVTTGALDWGYINNANGNLGVFFSNLGGTPGASYNNTPFGSLANDGGTTIGTASGASSIGTVTLTEGFGATAGTNVIDPQSNPSPFTFDGNATAGAYGNFAPTEQDIWTLALNDLGVGTFTITLYLGHSNTGRGFDMDIGLTDAGGNASVTTTVSPLSSLGSTVVFAGGAAFTHTVTVTTTSADASLTLTHGGTGGGSGGALFAGYTVTPEPSSLALLALGGLLMARRRR